MLNDSYIWKHTKAAWHLELQKAKALIEEYKLGKTQAIRDAVVIIHQNATKEEDRLNSASRRHQKNEKAFDEVFKGK